MADTLIYRVMIAKALCTRKVRKTRNRAATNPRRAPWRDTDPRRDGRGLFRRPGSRGRPSSPRPGSRRRPSSRRPGSRRCPSSRRSTRLWVAPASGPTPSLRSTLHRRKRFDLKQTTRETSRPSPPPSTHRPVPPSPEGTASPPPNERRPGVPSAADTPPPPRPRTPLSPASNIDSSRTYPRRPLASLRCGRMP